MAEAEVHQLVQCITCHAWNGDHTMIAICPNSSEVHIYKASPFGSAEWERLHVLKMHDQLVSGIAWAPSTNRIVTCSHDRNSYVWQLQDEKWQATLVILRLNRAALCVDWSPKANKFAVGSGAKSVCVCYYEAENNWWVSKLIKKRHLSSVTSVAWHPNNVLLATTSTDGKCRIFAAPVKGVDSKVDVTTAFGDNKFGEQLLQLDLTPAWTFGVRWSPSGSSLAYTGQDSTIHFVTNMGPDLVPSSLRLSHLALRDVAFLSETLIVAAGYDCNPLLFSSDAEGNWTLVGHVDEAKSTIASPQRSSQFSDAFGKFEAQTRRGENAESVEPMRVPATRHRNCITCILPLVDAEKKLQGTFSTSGLDGRIVVWNIANFLAAESLGMLTL